MNLPEIGYIILGCFAALVNGAVEPLFAISISDYIGAFSKYEYGSEELDKEILAWSMLCKSHKLLLKGPYQLIYKCKIQHLELVLCY